MKKFGSTVAVVLMFLLIVVELSNISDFGPGYRYHDIHTLLKGLSSETIDVVDPLDVFAARFADPKALWVLPHDIHKNAQAHKVNAEVVGQAILKTL